MASIFGRGLILPLTNKSGGALAKGDVVVVDSANNDAVTTTTTGSTTLPVGVVVEENGIASNAVGRVQFGGYVALVTVNASVTRGHYAFTHTVAKQATGSAARAVGAFGMFTTGGTTPAALLFSITDASTGAGGIAPSIVDAKGDLIAATAADTVARLAVGSDQGVLIADSSQSTGLAWRAGAWTTYTPTLSASPTPPTIGNGTLTGRWRYLDDKTIAVEISFVFGSTSAAGSGTWNFALPATAAGDTAFGAWILDNGTGYYSASGVITAAFSLGVVIFAVADTAGARNLTHNVPITPANGDRFVTAGIYRAA